jgi:hypothetical protein
MSLRKALWELNSFLPGEVPGSLNPQMLKVAIDHLDSITAAIPLVIDRLANELEELANNGKLKCTEQDSDLRMELLRLQAQLLAANTVGHSLSTLLYGANVISKNIEGADK